MVTFMDLKRAVDRFELEHRGDRKLDSSNVSLLLNDKVEIRSVNVRWAIHRCDYISLDVEYSEEKVDTSY